ncbi:hypothetical protein KY305_11285 [Bacillus sp. YC2]|uniref:hypothetical protein n=1 Tax=Bacillus sp. YC2 TaxID=2861287 RepID=UPI001CA71293|nr:hypothetical protein [Bacillus sp. YC2]MBY8913323.1 hypothetical protein [Bacillus sp. YC2]
MIQVYKYDEDYFFETPVIIQGLNQAGNIILPDNCTKIAPTDGMYKPQFHPEKGEWWEAASLEYIKGLEQDRESSDLEILKEQNALLISQLAKTQSMSKEQAQMYADLIFLLTKKGVI